MFFSLSSLNNQRRVEPPIYYETFSGISSPVNIKTVFPSWRCSDQSRFNSNPARNFRLLGSGFKKEPEVFTPDPYQSLLKNQNELLKTNSSFEKKLNRKNSSPKNQQKNSINQNLDEVTDFFQTMIDRVQQVEATNKKLQEVNSRLTSEIDQRILELRRLNQENINLNQEALEEKRVFQKEVTILRNQLKIERTVGGCFLLILSLAFVGSMVSNKPK